MDESRTDDIPQVSYEENNLLTAPYSEEEVRKAVFLMEHNKALGPDGLSLNSQNWLDFHGAAKGRHQKKLIHSLQQDEGKIEGHEQLKSYITNYYKNLFGAPEEGNFSMDESRTNDRKTAF